MLKGLRLGTTNLSFDEVLALAKEDQAGVPYPVVAAIVHAARRRLAERSETEVSVTDIVGCPRARVLKSTTDYYEDLEALMPAFRGQLMHQVLQMYADGETVVETRLSRPFGGYTVWGTPDAILCTRKSGEYVIRDFKSTRRIPTKVPWPNHVTQINLYRWLADLPTETTRMSVVYFDLNEGEVRELSVPSRECWGDDRVEAYLVARFLPIVQALDGGVLPPLAEVPADVLSWQCRYCPVFDACWAAAVQEPGGALLALDAARKRG